MNKLIWLRSRFGGGMCIVLFLAFVVPVAANAVTSLTLESAYDIAINTASQGRIIEGNMEVAEQNYFAERINFYVPEISINGSIPAYSADESFRFFGGATQKSLFKTTDLDFRSNIELKQSLLTGGDLTVTANLISNDARYPNTRVTGEFIDELTTQGFFDFKFEQPLLKPSEPKNRLNNRRDDLGIARLVHNEEVGSLKNQVTEAYFGVLWTALNTDISRLKVQSAKIQIGIDSVKLADGVLSEEQMLQSTSTVLDQMLDLVEAENQKREMSRDLAALLDMDASDQIEVNIPERLSALTGEQRENIIKRWSSSVPVQKAHFKLNKARRAADYAASSRGLNGTLRANYSLGRGTVETGGLPNDDINTNSWGVSVNFTYPVWDGGSSGAAIKSARLESDKAEFEFDRKKSAARAEVVNLINKLDVTRSKLDLMQRQIELAQNQNEIAIARHKDGQISMLTLLENKINSLESRIKRLDELKNLYLVRIELESKYGLPPA